jgi:hypothetical protein
VDAKYEVEGQCGNSARISNGRFPYLLRIALILKITFLYCKIQDDLMEYESFIEIYNVCRNFRKNSIVFVHHYYTVDGGLSFNYTTMYMK